MKRILNILLIFTMILTLSIPAYAWDFSGNLYDNIAEQEIIDNRPIYVGSNPNTLTFYNPIEEKYYHAYNFYSSIPTYEFQSSSGKLLNGAFDWSYWSGSEWILIQSDVNNVDISDLLLVHYSQCNLNIDGMSFVINQDGYIELGGEVQTPPSGGTDTPTTPDDGNDIDNSGLLSGLTDFLSGLLQGFLDLINFIWTLIEKLGQMLKSLLGTLKKIPELISKIDELFGADSVIMTFLDNVFPADNENAQNCKMVVLLIFAYGLFSFFYALIKRFMFK